MPTFRLADFDSPDSFDYPALRDCVRDLKECRAAQIPNYSFVHHQRTDETTYLYGANVIIVRPCPSPSSRGCR